MKPRNRDLNIFSMSALDLFASALGAFIVLAVIALPFFPNTSQLDDEEVLAELEAARAQLNEAEQENAELQADLEDAQTDRERLAAAVQRLRVEDMDVLIVVDVTGSMASAIDGIRTETGELIRVLRRMAPSLGVGIMTFGDKEFDCIITVHHPGEPCNRPRHSPPQPLVISDMGDGAARAHLDRYLDNVLDVNLGMRSGNHSGNTPEDIHLAMEHVLQTQWRSNSRERHVVVFTDAPARSGFRQRTLEATRAFASSPNHHVSTVQYPPWTGYVEATEDLLREMAEDIGNGQYVVQDRNESVLAALLLAIVREQAP